MRSHSIAAPALPRALSSSFTREFSVGADWAEVAQRIAAADCAVLLTGETGSGKGFVARWIHDHSRRSGKPFVPVNCGAIPEALIDSHLFGHARGAFSGADKDHPGLVRAAEGGTLLLDEIADLPITAQARLLRLLEEREVQPVGYSQPVKVDVRILAATSADLAQRVNAGTFRQDLLFRLDVVRLPLAPLRERREEIGRLLEMFNEEFARLYRQSPLQFDRLAMRMLDLHNWPGNVRELRTLVERLHVLCGRDAAFKGDVGACAGDDHDVRFITADDLKRFGQLPIAESPATSNRTLRVGPASVRLTELKIEAVNEALSACSGNMSRAADILGVHRSTLYRWLAGQQRMPA